MAKRIIVVGGGIVGCTTALLLSDAGYEVSVVERNQIAAQTSGEASWAGAGLLFPLLPWFYQDTVNALSLAGAARYPALCQRLHKESGIDPEYLQSGMRIMPPVDIEKALSWCQANGIEAQLQGQDLWLPTVGQVRNPKLMQSLKQTLLNNGVSLIENTQLEPIAETDNISSWATTDGRHLEADHYVVTSGAWSFELLKATAIKLNIKPMRGQILLYQVPADFLKTIVYQDGFYLVPRQDGYLLAGSTLEDVGFDTGITEAVKQELQQKAEAILPALKEAPIVKHWSGLRPGTPENLPTIAKHPTVNNLYLNTGHFRYGLTMAPASAARIVELIGE